MKVMKGLVVRGIALSTVVAVATTAISAATSQIAYEGGDGRLQYTADERGNKIPDFSNCGYMGGGVAIPEVVVRVTVGPVGGGGDDTGRLQKAIDEVAGMPVGGDGFRGAVLIKRGTYRVGGQLKVGVSGVVLRGEGDGVDGTVLVATGKKQRDLIVVEGTKGAVERKGGVEVVDEYVPVGARVFTVKDGAGLNAGDKVIVRRVGNVAWIHFIKMDQIQGRPGNEGSTKQWQAFDLPFDRVVTKVEGNKVTVDAPITCAIERKWGGGSVTKYDDAGRIERVGVENLRAVSEYDPKVTAKDHNETYASDEEHAMYLVGFDNVKNAWERNCTSVHFYHGPASIGRGAKWVTVQDCKALEPVSVLTGGRRYPFAIDGQLNLVQRCYAKDARHAFVVGARVCGPNVFLDGISERDHATSEPHHRWSVGGLYDNIHAQMAFQDRQWMGSGHGWAGANYVAWNCEGSLVCQQPPTAQNWAIGFVGKKQKGAFDRPEGYWESYGKHVEPRSLYLRQLQDRLGKGAVENISERGAATAAAAEIAPDARAIEVRNDQVRVSIETDGRTLTIERADGKMRASAVLWDGLGSKTTVRQVDADAAAGHGKGIEVTSAEGSRQVVWVEEGTPFVCTKVWAKNGGGEEKVVHDLITLKASVDVGRPLESMRWFGSDGLSDGPKGKASYAFLALADPKSNGGVVGGWLTHERASGIVLGGGEAGGPTVAAKSEYGRLVVPAGQTAAGETFAIGFFEDAREGLERFADLTAKFNHIKLAAPMCGYSTWYHAHALDQKRMAELAAFCKEQRLGDFGFNFLQIDDQWQIARRDFTSHKPTGPYPDGMKLTADHIKAGGVVAGLWLTPFGWDSKLPLFAEHQDWFVHRQDGKVYDVKWAGDCLDMTHPEAREFLRRTISRMTHEWGYGLLKIDGLWSGMACSILYPQPTYRDDGLGDAVFHDRTKTNEEVYRDGLRLVREAAGPGTFILGCNIAQNMRTMGASIGLVDSMRIGPDIKATWEAVGRCARPAGWLYFWNGRVWWNDPDCLMLREPLTLEMGQAWGSFIALSGQLHLVSEWLPGLPAERLDVLKRTIPNHAHAARPVDLFEREMPREWHMTWGEGEERYDVVGLFNWNTPASAATKPTEGSGQEEPTTERVARKGLGASGPITVRVDLKELGLPAGRYVGYDYWGKRFLPAFEGSAEFELPAGTCKVIALRRELDRPVVVSTSRHVTQGLVELSDVKWDGAAGVLSGKSRLVGEDPYELRLDAGGWVPTDASVSDEDAGAGVTASVVAGGRNVRVAVRTPVTRTVGWSVRFRHAQGGGHDTAAKVGD